MQIRMNRILIDETDGYACELRTRICGKVHCGSMIYAMSHKYNNVMMLPVMSECQENGSAQTRQGMAR